MWLKWLTPTPAEAEAMAESLRDLLRGAHKMRFSTMALMGMDVCWEVLTQHCRVWLVFWAEPEIELRS